MAQEEIVNEYFALGDQKTNTATYASGQVIAEKTPVGRVAATGKLIKSVETATDGSESPVGITPFAIDASGGDVIGSVYVAGKFNKAGVAFDASFDTDAKKAIAFDRTPIILIDVN